jgi:hypothetical protein
MSKNNNLSFNNLGYQISTSRLYNLNYNLNYIIYKLKHTDAKLPVNIWTVNTMYLNVQFYLAYGSMLLDS